MRSPEMANIYMEYFEEMAIKTLPLKKIMSLWYIDDTFILQSHQDGAKIMLDHVTSINLSM